MTTREIIKDVLIAVCIVWACMTCGKGHATDFMDTPQYEDEYYSIINWEDTSHAMMILDALRDQPVWPKGFFEKLTILNIKTPKEINTFVNATFKYRLDAFDTWHGQTVNETLARKSGDCKALAILKFHILKHLGYKDVKIATVLMPNGEGEIAGHAVVILNSAVVLDINDPYYYVFAYLKYSNGLIQAFDENGVKNLK